MKKSVFFAMFFVILAFITSCEKETETSSNSNGYFKFVQKTGLKTANESNFNLGTLYKSKKFYFVLSNVASRPLTNVTLSTNHSAFQIFPSQISVMESGFEQMIELNVLHGILNDAIGFCDLLPMNENLSTINISGKYFNGTDSITVVYSAQVKVIAKVFDVKLFDNEREINLEKPNFSSLGGDNGEYLGYDFDSQYVKLTNNGNTVVTAEYKIEKSEGGYITFPNVKIIPGETKILETNSLFQQGRGLHMFLTLFGEGAISNYKKLPLGKDGKSTLIIFAGRH